RLSTPVRVTSTGPAYQPLSSGAGTSAEVLGAVRSTLTPPTVLLVGLPALSLSDALAERSAPSPVIVLAAGQSPARPDSSSEQVQATVTSSAYQPSPFGAVVAAPSSEGAVLSMLIPASPPLAALPAASVAEALTCWAAPSP